LYYLRGPNRVFSVAIFVLLIGSSIPLLMPCWLLGVWVYHVSKAPPESAFVGWTAVVLPIVLYLLLQDSGWLVSLGRLPLAVLGPKEASYLFGNAQFALREYVVSCLAAIHFIGIATVLKSRKPLAAQWINWAAGATFSLYVTHAPVLHFVKAVVPDHTWLYLPICIAVALAFAWAFERRLASFRRLVLAILPGYDVVRKIPGAEAA
jgi:peptidoglycan/LPS O-acetylase OafA/YrhL